MSAPAPTQYTQGLGSVSGDQLNTFIQNVTNFAQLRSLTGAPGMCVYVDGAATVDDGGQGNFVWNATSTGPDNNSTIIMVPGTLVGAWLKQGTTTTVTTVATLAVDSVGASPSTLYSTVGYGFPATASGSFFGGSNLACRYIANYYAEAAIYAATTQGIGAGETGLYLTFNSQTGYQPPGGPTGQKAALQISANAASGGGYTWCAAMSCTYQAGWQGSGGNFGTGLEIDLTNNAANADVGQTTNIYGLWIAGQAGTYSLTAGIAVAPYALNGANYCHGIGIYVFGSYTTSYAAFADGTYNCTYGYLHSGIKSVAAFADLGTSPNGLLLAGSYSNAAILIQNAGAGNALITSGSTFIVNNGGAMFAQAIGSTKGYTIAQAYAAGLAASQMVYIIDTVSATSGAWHTVVTSGSNVSVSAWAWYDGVNLRWV